MTTTYAPGQIALFQGDPALILQVEAMSIQLSVIPGITSLIGDFHSELEEYDETPSPAFARRIEELRAYYADRFPVPATTPTEALSHVTVGGIEYQVERHGDTWLAYGDSDHVYSFAPVGGLADEGSVRAGLMAAIDDEGFEAAVGDLEAVGPNGDVAGYTYRADMMAPSRLVEQLIGEGRLAPGARGMDPEEALDQLAAIEGIDRQEETSFDSDAFPKVVFTCQVQAEDVPYLNV